MNDADALEPMMAQVRPKSGHTYSAGQA